MATLSERLVEAENAYHELVIGKAVARIRDANGEEVQYTQANRPALRDYIAFLANAIKNVTSGTPCGGPMRVIF